MALKRELQKPCVNSRISFCSLRSLFDLLHWYSSIYLPVWLVMGLELVSSFVYLSENKNRQQFYGREKRYKICFHLSCFSPSIAKDFYPCSVTHNSIWQSAKALKNNPFVTSELVKVEVRSIYYGGRSGWNVDHRVINVF